MTDVVDFVEMNFEVGVLNGMVVLRALFAQLSFGVMEEIDKAGSGNFLPAICAQL